MLIDFFYTLRAAKLLGEFRGMPPINMDALEKVLLNISEMICELPWLQELDLNPLIVDENGAIAADARGQWHEREHADRDVPCPQRLALRPLGQHVLGDDPDDEHRQRQQGAAPVGQAREAAIDIGLVQGGQVVHVGHRQRTVVSEDCADQAEPDMSCALSTTRTGTRSASAHISS